MAENPIADLVAGFQDAVAQVPEFVQPLIVAAAGAVPFIEGEGGAIVGVVGGLPPVVAGLAAAVGNMLCVFVVVVVAARARGAIVNRARADAADAAAVADEKPRSKGRERFQRWLVRFGVPGASLLGPLALPTHFTAATLVATGVPVRRILFWQALAIVLWTTIATVSVSLAVALAT